MEYSLNLMSICDQTVVDLSEMSRNFHEFLCHIFCREFFLNELAIVCYTETIKIYYIQLRPSAWESIFSQFSPNVALFKWK